METNSQKISNVTLGFMVIVAVFVDLLQALISIIPWIGWLLSSLFSLFTFGIFALWYKTQGLKFTLKRSSLLGGGLLLEAVPLLNSLPLWTGTVLLTVLDIRLKQRAAKGFHSEATDRAA